MKIRFISALMPVAALCLLLPPIYGQQDAGATAQTQDQGGWRGQRGSSGGGFGMFAGGRGTVGTVTAAAADHYTIRTETGETYTVHFSANTRIMKQLPGRRGQDRGEDRGERTPPQPIKADEIKVGDVIAANGEIDEAAKSVGAVFIVQLDPERVKQMREMEANYGKTWLMGKVTAIDGVKVTLEGIRDKVPYTFVADENTDFRRRREPITLADIQVGDMIRVEGAVKKGTFVAATVGEMGGPRQEGTPSKPIPNPQ
jgi:Domain of unknown function (DUF5666)